ncbi:J domain-containing protein required for chloroplast accumulation response 1 isoform X2 [Salvia miltiorrhiza]|nr:J domain-containing protein required for chloroplast accumulation response 1 isoform X2 [Salvia miltiorrhiza]
MDLPTFGSQNHGQQHKVDGLSIPQSWSPFSRFSNEASGRLDEVEPVSHQRPLSDEAEDSPISDQKDKDVSIGNDQFHFSIYKWEGGRGVPMLMPLVIGNNLKSKDGIKYDEMSAKPESLRSELAEGDVRSRRDKKQELDYVFEAFHESSESKSKISLNDSVVLDTSVKEEQVKSVDGSSVRDKVEKKVHVKISEGLDAFLDRSDQPEMKDKKARAQPVDGDSKKMKERGRKVMESNNAKVEKSTKLEAASEVKSGAAKGKVKEFVQIFNQDAADSRPEADARGSRRWGNVVIDPKGNSNQAKVEEQVNLHDVVDKKPDVSYKEVENLKSNEAQRFSPKRVSTSTRSSSTLRRSFSTGALPEDFKISGEKVDDPLEDTFEVHELSDGNENAAHVESSEETKAIDAKIRQWSVGKKGNIRSLLSTLQYVLWAESGWKPVPLVDLVETNSVKRAYQKALLRLHPDKLQQKGAAFHHKYIAAKVFDILQEAWDHFNTCSSLGI